MFLFLTFPAVLLGTRGIQIHLAAEGDAGAAGKSPGTAERHPDPRPDVRFADEGDLQD